jgi:RND family efflux transporter MFP subunit
MRKKPRIWLALGAALLAASGMACGGASGKTRAAENSSNPSAEPAPAAARAANPAPATTDILSVLTVEHQVTVLSRIPGVVETIAKDEGDAVRQGDLLARLDDRTLQAQLAHDRDDLIVAKDNVQYQQAELKSKQANYRRYQELRKLGLSSEADLEKARFEAVGAQYDLKSWHAVVQRTQSQIRIAQLEIQKTEIRAPFDGVVARRYIRQGQAIENGARCFLVTQLRPLEVRFPVPETSLPSPRVGDRVRVSLAGGGSRVFTAEVIRVGPVVDPATASWDVLARLVAPPRDLRPGMAVRVTWPPESGRVR